MTSADEEVEVVHTNQALEVVSGWLGVSAEEAFKDAPAELPGSGLHRRQFAGLGAKAASHKDAATGDLLGRRLKRQIDRRQAYAREDAADAAGTKTHKPLGAALHQQSRGHHPAGGKHPARAGQGRGQAATEPDTEEDSGSDGEGRAVAVVSAGSKRKALSAAELRQQLLAVPTQQEPGGGKKHKKKKHNNSAGAQPAGAGAC